MEDRPMDVRAADHADDSFDSKPEVKPDKARHTTLQIHKASSIADYIACLALITAHIEALQIPEASSFLDVTPNSLRACYNSDGAGFLQWFSSENTSVGCLAYKQHAVHCAQLNYFYVRPEHRGRGAGQALMQAALEYMEADGYRRVILSTMPFLNAGRVVYERFGFEQMEPEIEEIPGSISYLKYVKQD